MKIYSLLIVVIVIISVATSCSDGYPGKTNNQRFVISHMKEDGTIQKKDTVRITSISERQDSVKGIPVKIENFEVYISNANYSKVFRVDQELVESEKLEDCLVDTKIYPKNLSFGKTDDYVSKAIEMLKNDLGFSPDSVCIDYNRIRFLSDADSSGWSSEWVYDLSEKDSNVFVTLNVHIFHGPTIYIGIPDNFGAE